MSDNNFAHALVVGASSGIGEALARRLAADGARVALVARREHELRRIMDEINDAAGEERAIAVAHDVRAADEAPDLVQEIARRLGGLDLVIYAAGAMPAASPGTPSRASLPACRFDVAPVRLVVLIAIGVGCRVQGVIPGSTGGRSDRAQASLVGGVGALTRLGE